MEDTLLQRATKEFDDYKRDLKSLPVNEIINSSYKTVVYEEFLDLLAHGGLEKSQTKSLLKMEKPLAGLYDDWMSVDAKLCEVLEYSLYDTLEKLENSELNNSIGLER